MTLLATHAFLADQLRRDPLLALAQTVAFLDRVHFISVRLCCIPECIEVITQYSGSNDKHTFGIVSRPTHPGAC